MTIYVVTTTNWSDPTFWASISETVTGHTLDFSGLPADYTVYFDADSGVLMLDDGTTFFSVGDTAYTGAADATLGGTSLWNLFDNVSSGSGDDTIVGGAGNDSILGSDGNDVIDGDGPGFSFASDFNNLATDPGITTSGGSTSNGSALYTFSGSSYIVADPDEGGADIGDVDGININFFIDMATFETQPISFSFGDPNSILSNPSNGLTDGLTVQLAPATDEVIFFWDGVEVGREPAGYDVDRINGQNASVSVDVDGLIMFTGAGGTKTAQIPGDEWATTDTSDYAFVAGMTPASGFSYITNIAFSGIARGVGDDTIYGGEGSDEQFGGLGNDLFIVNTPGDGAGDVIVGGEDHDLDGDGQSDDVDVLDLTGSNVDFITYVDGDPEAGTVTFLDGSTMTFSEIENVIPCFTPGTTIATPKGERLVEELREGDRIITRDNGIQEIRWVGRKEMSGKALVANPHLKPILIRAGALGNGLPERDMLVSPNHRCLVASEKTQLYFEEREVLAAAKHLVGAEGIHAVDVMGTAYIHFMFDRHEVVLSNGAWTESFQPGDYSLKGIGNAQRNEIFELFPELQSKTGLEDYPSVRRTLKKHEAKLLVK